MASLLSYCLELLSEQCSVSSWWCHSHLGHHSCQLLFCSAMIGLLLFQGDFLSTTKVSNCFSSLDRSGLRELCSLLGRSGYRTTSLLILLVRSESHHQPAQRHWPRGQTRSSCHNHRSVWVWEVIADICSPREHGENSRLTISHSKPETILSERIIATVEPV